MGSSDLPRRRRPKVGKTHHVLFTCFANDSAERCRAFYVALNASLPQARGNVIQRRDISISNGNLKLDIIALKLTIVYMELLLNVIVISANPMELSMGAPLIPFPELAVRA